MINEPQCDPTCCSVFLCFGGTGSYSKDIVEVDNDRAEVHHPGAPVAVDDSNLSSQDEVQTAYWHISMVVCPCQMISQQTIQSSYYNASVHAELHPDGLSQAS